MIKVYVVPTALFCCFFGRPFVKRRHKLYLWFHIYFITTTLISETTPNLIIVNVRHVVVA